MRARQLEVFTAIMRAGTVTAAARLLNTSQPALSQILLHTEDELGFALFDRVKGRLRPTPEAQELFPEAERLFAGLEGLRRKTADLRVGRAGLVRIVTSPPPAMTVLPHAMAEFRARHPQIVLRSSVAPVASMVTMLRDGDAALGLALDDRLPPDIKVEPMGQTRFVCVMADDHPLAGRSTVGFADLEGHVVISYRGSTRPAEELAAAARDAGAPLVPAIEIDVSISAVGFVQAGLGVAVVDAMLPWAQFAGLAVRPLENSPHLPVSLLSSRGRSLSRAESLMERQLRLACKALQQQLAP